MSFFKKMKLFITDANNRLAFLLQDIDINYSKIKKLLDMGANPNYLYNNEPIMFLVYHDYLALKLLFEYGADPNLPDIYGISLLKTTLKKIGGPDSNKYIKISNLISSYGGKEYL